MKFARLFAVVAVFFHVASGSPIYTIIDLGTLGGSSSSAYAINDSGRVVGSATNAGEYDRAFSWFGGMSELQDTSQGTASGRGVSASGDIIGTGTTWLGSQAILWDATGAHTLGSLGGAESYGLGINDAGISVGAAMTAQGQLHAFEYFSGVMLDLGSLPGGAWSAAYAINDTGVIAGVAQNPSGQFSAVRWDSTGAHALGTLGGRDSYAFGINGSAAIVGSSAVASGYLHAFLYTLSGGMSDLGTLGGVSSYAYGINASGTIVGYSLTRDNRSVHATVWKDGVLYDLNTVAGGLPGFVLNEAYGINDQGQIVGTGTYMGQSRAFLLTPALAAQSISTAAFTDAPVSGVPEPAMSVGTGILLMLIATCRRKAL